MKKILLQLDTDLQPSVFDSVTAVDSADCVLFRHGGVTPENVEPLVHGCMFTRAPKDLHSTAIFIGGSDIIAAQNVLNAVKKTLWEPLNVSVMFDPNGCNTTAASAVYNIASNADVKGKRVVVMAGTGPVGQRAAAMLLNLGAQVCVTSRKLAKAQEAAASIEGRFGKACACAQIQDDGEREAVLDGAAAALCCGAAGVQLLSEDFWRDHKTLEVIADVNAVPPLGAQGTKTHWCGEKLHGKMIFGAIGIGWLKMKIHHMGIARLFEAKGLTLDAENIYELACEAIKS